MKVQDQVSAEKLRGGFYTPEPLVDLCWQRVADLVEGRRDLQVLEPSSGDGAFLRSLPSLPIGDRITSVDALEPDRGEAKKCRSVLRATGIAGRVLVKSAVSWPYESKKSYDIAVGNPPYVRYQFINQDDQTAIARLGKHLGDAFSGVGNLWIPVLIGALSSLKQGGAFSFVVPTECFTGCSAGAIRQWLIKECTSFSFDFFPAGSFPGVLQEVAILSGQRQSARESNARMTIFDHFADGTCRTSVSTVTDDGVWTKHFLNDVQRDALRIVQTSDVFTRLGDVAAFEVSIVTGANDFFSVTQDTIEEFGLVEWAKPMVPKIRFAPGLEFNLGDWERAVEEGARCWLLDFSDQHRSPVESADARAYLVSGEERGLPSRYKCRIRTPWYRVPGIVSGDLMLSKRSHFGPRVVVNRASVLTTDTIYRGRLKATHISVEDFVAAFHNSVTLLTAELEGRSFGGGVLELVPSEIARLSVPVIPGFGSHFQDIDLLSRQGAQGVQRATDQALVADCGLDGEVLAVLAEAREILLERRLLRNRKTSLPAPQLSAA